MAKIRSKDTKPEIWFRKRLFKSGYRYRKNSNSVPGHPDIWLAKYNTAVFVHGCFWHRHEGCKYSYMPKSRIEFWSEKFRRNTERDMLVQEKIREMNIRCLIIWECTVNKMIKDEEFAQETMKEVECFLRSDKQFVEF